MSIEHHCDRRGCQATFMQKKGERNNLPAAWGHLGLKGYNNPVFEVCPACAVDLGIADEAKQNSLGDKLIEVIGELVQDEVEARCPE